jgi:hypothetical protein
MKKKKRKSRTNERPVLTQRRGAVGERVRSEIITPEIKMKKKKTRTSFNLTIVGIDAMRQGAERNMFPSAFHLRKKPKKKKKVRKVHMQNGAGRSPTAESTIFNLFFDSTTGSKSGVGKRWSKGPTGGKQNRTHSAF